MDTLWACGSHFGRSRGQHSHLFLAVVILLCGLPLTIFTFLLSLCSFSCIFLRYLTSWMVLSSIYSFQGLLPDLHSGSAHSTFQPFLKVKEYFLGSFLVNQVTRLFVPAFCFMRTVPDLAAIANSLCSILSRA